jgi:hypothetical protein
MAPSFLTSTLDGAEWSTSLSDHFTHMGKNPRYLLDMRLGGPDSRILTYNEVTYNTCATQQKARRCSKNEVSLQISYV